MREKWRASSVIIIHQRLVIFYAKSSKIVQIQGVFNDELSTQSNYKETIK